VFEVQVKEKKTNPLWVSHWYSFFCKMGLCKEYMHLPNQFPQTIFSFSYSSCELESLASRQGRRTPKFRFQFLIIT